MMHGIMIDTHMHAPQVYHGVPLGGTNIALSYNQLY